MSSCRLSWFSVGWRCLSWWSDMRYWLCVWWVPDGYKMIILSSTLYVVSLFSQAAFAEVMYISKCLVDCPVPWGLVGLIFYIKGTWNFLSVLLRNLSLSLVCLSGNVSFETLVIGSVVAKWCFQLQVMLIEGNVGCNYRQCCGDVVIPISGMLIEGNVGCNYR